MLSLLGLQDTYVHDGRVLIEALDAVAVPQALRAHRETLIRLGEAYKQLNAPFGDFARAALDVSTVALASGDDSSDATYTGLQATVAAWTDRRDAIATQMRAMLASAAFSARAINEQQAKGLIDDAQALIGEAVSFAAGLPALPAI
jgi:hypothetical protein